MAISPSRKNNQAIYGALLVSVSGLVSKLIVKICMLPAYVDFVLSIGVMVLIILYYYYRGELLVTGVYVAEDQG
jgi:hypothetical protein